MVVNTLIMVNKVGLLKDKVILSLFLLLLGCEKNDLPAGVPTCLTKKVRKESAVKVWEYTYQNQVVYYLRSECCDKFNYLYDSECNLICAPDGGLTGQGDSKCQDFFRTRINEKLIWEKEE